MTCQYILCLFLLLVNGNVWAKNIGETCTPPSGEDADECSVDNSECKTNKCACKDGFTEDGGNCLKDLGVACGNADECVSNAVCDSTCKCKTGYEPESGLCQKVLGSTCSAANAATVCTVTGSECQGTTCTCKDGQTEENDVCKKVLGSQCNGDSACPGATNSKCENSKCACAADYEEKNDACKLTVSGTVCTDTGVECDSIDNAICDAEGGKCKCSPGFTMNIDTCVSENGAATTRHKEATILAISVLVAIKVVFG